LFVPAVALALAVALAAAAEPAQPARPPPVWTPLGRGVEHLAVAQGEIEGHAFRFRPSDVELRIVPAPEGRADVSELAPAGDVIATNASFFDEAGKAMGLTFDRGRSLAGPRLVKWGAFVVEGGRARIVRGAEIRDPGADALVVQGLPRLVIHGDVPKLKAQRAARTAVCTESGRVVLVVTTSRVDTTEFARFLAAPAAAGGLGCEDALNLDGGPSTQLAARWGGFDAQVEGGWPVPNALVVAPKAR